MSVDYHRPSPRLSFGLAEALLLVSQIRVTKLRAQKQNPRGGGVLGGRFREGVHGASLLRLNNAFITTCALRPFQRNERLRLVSA